MAVLKMHQLRHSFACANYARNGHDIVAVQELLGHTSVATTQNAPRGGAPGKPGAPAPAST